MPTTRERTGVIVIRVWLEPSDDGFRARVTAVHDLEEDEVDTAVAGSVEEIVEIVRRFVAAFTES